MVATPLVQLQNVKKLVMAGDTPLEILRGVSLDVQPGEFLAIMGASGSGKSTLLNVIGLLDGVTSGTVRILDQEATRLSDDQVAALRARAIGFIFQSFNLLSYLPARDNVSLPLIYGGRKVEPGRADALLTELQMGHRLNAFPTTLSGGERQRVAIARALMNRPQLLLADEPTGALDTATGKQILDLLSALHRQGMSIIVVTHDPLVAQRAQRILRMQDGRFL